MSTQKQLQDKIERLREENGELKLSIAAKQRTLSDNEKIITALSQQIKSLQSPSLPTISDHAILRYLERVKGIDIESIRMEILSPELMKIITTLGGTGKYPDKDYKLILKDNKIITIVTNE